MSDKIERARAMLEDARKFGVGESATAQDCARAALAAIEGMEGAEAQGLREELSRLWHGLNEPKNTKVENNMETKNDSEPVKNRCTKCGEEKELDKFAQHHGKPGKTCKECTAAYQRELWRKKHPGAIPRIKEPPLAPEAPCVEEAASPVAREEQCAEQAREIAYHAGYALRLAVRMANEGGSAESAKHHVTCAGALWTVMLSLLEPVGAREALTLALSGIAEALGLKCDKNQSIDRSEPDGAQSADALARAESEE